MLLSVARFVYQELSTEVSPERNHISSERRWSSWREMGRLEGRVWRVRAWSDISFGLEGLDGKGGQVLCLNDEGGKG